MWITIAGHCPYFATNAIRLFSDLRVSGLFNLSLTSHCNVRSQRTVRDITAHHAHDQQISLIIVANINTR